MQRLPKFRPRHKGPLNQHEHTECVKMLGSIYDNMVESTDETGHVLAGRIMSYREQACPCVYVFYNKSSFEDEQSGLMYHLQDLEEGDGFEIVFRMWRGIPPLRQDIWQQLGDDRYKVCSANIWRWRGFQVRSSPDKLRARELVFAAKASFEEIFN